MNRSKREVTVTLDHNLPRVYYQCKTYRKQKGTAFISEAHEVLVWFVLLNICFLCNVV